MRHPKPKMKDMGQQMGYRGLEWNWPKEAMNRPIWAGIVDGAKLFSLYVIFFLCYCFFLVPVIDRGRYGIYS